MQLIFLLTILYQILLFLSVLFGYNIIKNLYFEFILELELFINLKIEFMIAIVKFIVNVVDLIIIIIL